MRLIIWTQDNSIQDMAASLDAVDVVVCPDSKDLESQVKSLPEGELGLLVLDRDEDPDRCQELHREFRKTPGLKRLWLTAEKSAEILRQWQFQEDSPEMILSKDLGRKELESLIGDLNWAQKVEGPGTETEEVSPEIDERVVDILKHHGAYISPEKLEEQYYVFDKEGPLNQKIQEKFNTFLKRADFPDKSDMSEKDNQYEIQNVDEEFGDIESEMETSQSTNEQQREEEGFDSMTVPAMEVGNVSWQQDEEDKTSQYDEEVMSENKKKKSQGKTDEGLAFNLPMEEESNEDPDPSESQETTSEAPEKSEEVSDEEITDELEFEVSSDSLEFNNSSEETPEEKSQTKSDADQSEESTSHSFELPEEDDDEEGFEGLGFNMTGIEELKEETDAQKAAPKVEKSSEQAAEKNESQSYDESALDIEQDEGDELEFSDGMDADQDSGDSEESPESHEQAGGLALGDDDIDEFEIDRGSDQKQVSEEEEEIHKQNEASSTSIDLDVDEVQSQEGEGSREMTQTEYMEDSENDEINRQSEKNQGSEKSSADVLEFSQAEETSEKSEKEETGELPSSEGLEVSSQGEGEKPLSEFSQDDQASPIDDESAAPEETPNDDATRATVVMDGEALNELSQQDSEGLQPRAQDEATDEIDISQLEESEDPGSSGESPENERTSTQTHNYDQPSQSQGPGESDSTETLGSLTGTKGTETQVGMALNERHQSPSGEKTEGVQVTPQDQRLPSAFQEDEMARYQATIRQLREERDQLLSEVENVQQDKKLVDRENTGLKAELEDLKIELNILKKRHAEEIDEMQYRVRVSEEKKQILEEKAKHYQKEFERLSQRVRMDFNKIKQREKELESQLELVSMDSESQVRSRDSKILELKRKIDQLEFNMENAQIREQKIKEDKAKMEEKLSRLMKSLKGSIELLETDSDIDQELIDRLKKA